MAAGIFPLRARGIVEVIIYVGKGNFFDQKSMCIRSLKSACQTHKEFCKPTVKHSY